MLHKLLFSCSKFHPSVIPCIIQFIWKYQVLACGVKLGFFRSGIRYYTLRLREARSQVNCNVLTPPFEELNHLVTVKKQKINKEWRGVNILQFQPLTYWDTWTVGTVQWYDVSSLHRNPNLHTEDTVISWFTVYIGCHRAGAQVTISPSKEKLMTTQYYKSQPQVLSQAELLE